MELFSVLLFLHSHDFWMVLLSFSNIFLTVLSSAVELPLCSGRPLHQNNLEIETVLSDSQ